MSSFKDNFTRGSGDSNLQYDDTAFYYFSISMLAAVSFVLLFFIVKRIFATAKNTKARINHVDLTVAQKIGNQGSSLKNTKFNFSFILLIGLLVLCLYAIFSVSQLVNNKDKMKRFDPYEILGISRDATMKDIRSAYKKMILKYHPDRNPSPEANAMFLLVTKANECLTDESKRSVCEQFGSPDGPGSLQVAIAMPSFFQKKENHVFILAFFSLVFIIVLPASVFIWLNKSQAKNGHGMAVENYKIAFQQLSQNMAPSKLIEIIGFSQEFKYPINKQEQEYFRRHTQFLDEVYPSTKGIPATKAQKLLILRFEGIAVPNAQCQQELDFILQKAPCVIDSVIDHCLQINNILPKTDKRYMSVQSLHNVIYFQQHFFQGIWSTKTEIEFNQLSPVFADQISIKKLIMRYKNIRTLLSLPKEERKYDLTNDKLPEAQKEAIINRMNEEVDSIPRIAVEVEVLIDQETDQKLVANAANRNVNITVEAGQIIGFKVNITYENYPEEANADGKFALTHRYPYFKDMHMHIYMTEKDRIIEYSLLTGQKRKLEFLTKKALPEGEFNFEIFTAPDCFIGLDSAFRVTAKVTPRTEKQTEDADFHPYDIEKASEPSFIEKLLLAQQGGQAQDDDDEEEETQKEDKSKKIQGKSSSNNEPAADQEDQDEEQEEEITQESMADRLKSMTEKKLK